MDKNRALLSLLQGDGHNLYGILFAHPVSPRVIVTCQSCETLLSYQYHDGSREDVREHREGCPVPAAAKELRLVF